MKVTAEGVETAVALALLTGMGCDMAQGYFIARPMMLADFIAFVDQAPAKAEPPRASARAGAG
jgi:EAL domain-containing protein (putative c-di-GMP-specific phosphodiesterase class I)